MGTDVVSINTQGKFLIEFTIWQTHSWPVVYSSQIWSCCSSRLWEHGIWCLHSSLEFQSWPQSCVGSRLRLHGHLVMVLLAQAASLDCLTLPGLEPHSMLPQHQMHLVNSNLLVLKVAMFVDFNAFIALGSICSLFASFLLQIWTSLFPSAPSLPPHSPYLIY